MSHKWNKRTRKLKFKKGFDYFVVKTDGETIVEVEMLYLTDGSTTPEKFPSVFFSAGFDGVRRIIEGSMCCKECAGVNIPTLEWVIETAKEHKKWLEEIVEKIQEEH